MTLEEVQKLAKMMRVQISAEEAESVGRDMDAVIHYIEHLNEITVPSRTDQVPMLFNIAREDVAEHESGMYTEQILRGAPAVENNFVKVKKVL